MTLNLKAPYFTQFSDLFQRVLFTCNVSLHQTETVKLTSINISNITLYNDDNDKNKLQKSEAKQL